MRRCSVSETVKDLRPAFHARVYHCAIEDSRLSAADLVTLVKIARFADFNSGMAWPGVRRIASMGVEQHPGTICRSIKRLEKFKYLAVKRRAGGAGQNVYYLTLPQLHNLTTSGGVFASGEHPVRLRRTARVRSRRTE